MSRELGVFVAENTADNLNPHQTEGNAGRLVEIILGSSGEIDGWKTRLVEITVKDGDEVFNTQAREVLKETRGFRILFSPNGHVYKIAKTTKEDTALIKELLAYQAAEEIFELETLPKLVQVESDYLPPAKTLDMPYFGLPIRIWEEETGVNIPASELDAFKERMIRLVYEQGVVHQDVNSGNILVRMKDGRPQLMAIDWELCSLITELPQINRDPFVDHLERELSRSLAPYYPQNDA